MNIPEKTEEAPGLIFPCTIDVKIFVLNHSDEEALIRDFVAEQLEAHHLIGWSSRESSGGKYLAITVKVDAQNRQHIHEFYQALTDHERVVMLI